MYMLFAKQLKSISEKQSLIYQMFGGKNCGHGINLKNMTYLQQVQLLLLALFDGLFVFSFYFRFSSAISFFAIFTIQ